jgi:hypothetical protein
LGSAVDGTGARPRSCARRRHDRRDAGETVEAIERLRRERSGAAFDRKPGKPAGPSLAKRTVQQLQEKSAIKNEVIAELMEENDRLKN